MGNPSYRALWPWVGREIQRKFRKQARKLRLALAGASRYNTAPPGPEGPALDRQAWSIGRHGGRAFALREIAYDLKMAEHTGHLSDRAFKAAHRASMARGMIRLS